VSIREKLPIERKKNLVQCQNFVKKIYRYFFVTFMPISYMFLKHETYKQRSFFIIIQHYNIPLPRWLCRKYFETWAWQTVCEIDSELHCTIWRRAFFLF